MTMIDVWKYLCLFVATQSAVIAETKKTQTDFFFVMATIQSRFSETTVSSFVTNDDLKSKEIDFSVVLPQEAFITSFAMSVNGKWYQGEIEEKLKAQGKYRIAKEKKLTASLVETKLSSMKIFKMKVNVAPGDTVEFKLIYQQLLRRIRGKYRQEITFLGSQISENPVVSVHICESRSIYNITALPITTNRGKKLNPVVSISQDNKNSANIDFLPLNNPYLNKILTSEGGMYAIEYEMEPADSAGELVISEGYFLHFFAPTVDIKPRRVVFVLDVSGSMMRTRNKLKWAVIHIIKNLSKKDRFTIVIFGTEVKIWKGISGLLLPANERNIEEAQTFLKSLDKLISGYTNMYGALQTSMNILKKDIDGSEADPSTEFVVLFTDGEPNLGSDEKVNKKQLLSDIALLNSKKCGINVLAFGSDLDSDFLNALATQNRGSWRRIFSDITSMAIQINSYLDELFIRSWENITVTYPDVVNKSTITQRPVMSEETMVTGLLNENTQKQKDTPQFLVLQETQEDETFSMRFFTDNTDYQCHIAGREKAVKFAEKAHALSSVQETLRMYYATSNPVKKKNLRERTLRMALKFQLVTPLTSMVVFKPRDNEVIETEYEKEYAENDLNPTARPPITTTIPSWAYRGDPHVLIRLSDGINVCFEWQGEDGEIYNFLYDDNRGILINGVIGTIFSQMPGKNTSANRIFVVKTAIYFEKIKLFVKIKPDSVNLQDLSRGRNRKSKVFLPVVNIEAYEYEHGEVIFRISNVTKRESSLTILISSKPIFKFGRVTILHVGDPWIDEESGVNPWLTVLAMGLSVVVNLQIQLNRVHDWRLKHVNVELFDRNYFSKLTSGIFGYFSKIPDARPRITETTDGKFYINIRGRSVPVTKRKYKIDENNKIPCWHSDDPAQLLDHELSAFRVSSLLDKPRTLIRTKK